MTPTEQRFLAALPAIFVALLTPTTCNEPNLLIDPDERESLFGELGLCLFKYLDVLFARLTPGCPVMNQHGFAP